ncbi:MAG: hypothetical protein ACYC5F_11140 [Thermoleophilia bacterium]
MSFDDSDLEAIVGDSNGGAFRKDEIRSGPPLDYVAEKARSGIEQLHRLLASIDALAPSDLPQPAGVAGTTFLSRADSLRGPAHAAFHYAIVSYLALNNMLHLANDRRHLESLSSMSWGELDKWLDVIDREGSVTG